MNEILKKDTYEGFNYPVSQLSKYIRASDIFTIMLKDQSIIHHTVDIKDANMFEKWLLSNQITNITPEKRSEMNQGD